MIKKNFEKTSGGAFRNGRVIATDSKFTGEEPTWEDAANWEPTKLQEVRDQALRFYNYYLCNGDLKLSLLQWMSMKDHGAYTEEQIKCIQGAPDHSPSSAASKLCRCILKGMPPSEDEIAFIREKISETISDVNRGAFRTGKAKSESKEPPISMAEKIRVKVRRTVIQDLEGILDQWITTISGLEDDKVPDMHKFLESHDCPPQGLPHVTEWVNGKLGEFLLVLQGDDEQLVEAYSYVPVKTMKNWVKYLEGMKVGISTYLASKKALKKPRAKKAKPAEKQVAKVKYATSCKEFNITSISPILIVGARHVWVYNMKYRNLQYYEAESPAGLSVKGTSIKGFNEKASYKMSLRKPELILPTVVSKTFLQVDKEIKKLTTKVREPNGRLNEETVILRAIDN